MMEANARHTSLLTYSQIVLVCNAAHQHLQGHVPVLSVSAPIRQSGDYERQDRDFLRELDAQMKIFNI